MHLPLEDLELILDNCKQIKFKLVHKIKHGGHGTVFKATTGVVKWTIDENEAQIAALYLSGTLKSNILPIFYNVWHIPHRYYDTYLIHREDISDLKFFDPHRWLTAMVSIDYVNYRGTNLTEALSQNRSSVAYADQDSYDRVSSAFKDIWNSSGIRFRDLGPDNWGSRDGNIVLRDASAISSTLKKTIIPSIS